MKKLNNANQKNLRRKIKLSTSKENKLITIIKKIFRIKLPKAATLDDIQTAINEIPYNKIDSYVDKYTKNLLKYNREGFIKIINSMVSGNSGSFKLQELIDKQYSSFVKNERILQPLLSKFKENVKLIKNIPQEVVNKLQEGYLQGVSFRGTEVEEYLTNKLGIRARLIIRTESAKVNSAMTEIRARNVGLIAYIWSTSEDRRVRPSHKIMNGVLVFYGTLITLDGMTGGPGETVNCRCIGLPVVELDDIQFPIKVAEGNLTIKSKYIKGSHGKDYDVDIQSGAIRVYNKQEFMKKYGDMFT